MPRPIFLQLFILTITAIALLSGCTCPFKDEGAGTVIEEKAEVFTETASEDSGQVAESNVIEMTKEPAGEIEEIPEPYLAIPTTKDIPSAFYADLADVFLRHRRMEMASRLVEEAVSREENDEIKSLYWVKLAETNARMNQSREAAEAYEKAVTLTSSQENKIKYYQELGKLYGRIPDFNKGIEAYRFLFENEKDDSKILGIKRQLYTFYNNAGRIREVTEDLVKQTEENPDAIEPLEELAFIYQHILNIPNQAIPYLKSLSEKVEAPENRKYLTQLLNCYRQLERYDEQAQVMLEIMEQLPETHHESYLIRIAQIYSEGRKFDKALEFADKALEIGPDNPLTVFQVADVYCRSEAGEKAEEFFEKAVSLARDNFQKQSMYYQFALSNIAVKNFVHADELFEIQETLIDGDEIKFQLYDSAGNEFVNAGNTELADKWVRKLITLDPKSAAPYHKIAQFHERNKQIEKAMAVLSEGLSVLEKPEDKVALLVTRYSLSRTSQNMELAKESLDMIEELAKEERILNWVREQRKEIEK